jgi:hypothetical protein
VIDKLKETRCTQKQKNILAKYGYPTDLPFEKASEVITRIVAAGWKRPPEDGPA